MSEKELRVANDNSIIRFGRLKTFLSEIKKIFVAKEAGKGLSSNDFTNTLLNKLNGIENNAQVNKIEKIKKNGTVLSITNKEVNITVPTKTSEINNDSGFITNTVNNLTNYYTKTLTYTKEEVNNLVNSLPHLKFKIVDELPSVGEENIIYLVKKQGSETDVHDEYIFINGEPELIGSTGVDLTGYLKESDIGTLIAGLGSDKKIKQENLPQATTSIYGAIKFPITKDKMSADYQKDVANGVVGLDNNNKINNSHLSLSNLTINNNGVETVYNPTSTEKSVSIDTMSQQEVETIINNKFDGSKLNFTGTENGDVSYPLLTGGTKTIAIPTSLPNPQPLKFTNAENTKTISYKGNEEVTVTEKKYTAESLMPLGSVIIWFKKVDIPNGFLECNGAEVSKTQYKDLYSLIGTKFGAETTDKFKLPKLNESVKWYANESETSEEIIYLIKAIRTDVYALSLT